MNFFLYLYTMSVIKEIKQVLEPYILKLLNDLKISFKKQYGTNMSEHVQKLTKIELEYDMTVAVEKYTLPTDVLIRLNKAKTRKGSLVIEAIIGRDEKEYFFSTEVIIAGGYNIQRLHYRYLTNTTLPKTNISLESDLIKKEIKRLKGIEKYRVELENYEARINKLTEEINVAKVYSDSDIIEMLKIEKPILTTTWADIVSRNVEKNYNNNEEVFVKSQETYLKSSVKSWKTLKIESKIINIENIKREVQRINKKLLIINK